jgi:Ca2+-binding RTX toxin-like protein
MAGGAGDDTYVVNAAGDVVTEGADEGTDTVQSSVSYTLAANVENLTLTGTAAINGTGNDLDNRITGNAAANVLDGGLGADTLSGGLGNDTYVVDSADDVVQEAAGGGTDLVRSSVSYTLPDQVENLTLLGTAAIDGTGNDAANTLTGNTADNRLAGGLGNDKLSGGAGNDTLAGGLGNDTLTGGTGQDVFRFDTALNTTTNRDTIADFVVADDTFELLQAVFAGLEVGDLSAEAFWKSASATTAHDADDRIVYNTTTGALYYDADGLGGDAPIQFATLTGSPDTVTAADFVVT